MARDIELIIDNVLCYLSTASKDLNNQTIYEIIKCFFSYDQIKNAKIKLGKVLNKDITTRRDPDKIGKELKDIFDYYEDWTDEVNVMFVCDGYNKMPPNGMESIAVTLSNLGEEVVKINNEIPKFSDVRSEIVNISDMMRNLRIEVANIKKCIPMQPNKPDQKPIVKSFRDAVFNGPHASKPIFRDNNQGSSQNEYMSPQNEDNNNNFQIPTDIATDIPKDIQDRQQKKIAFYANPNIQDNEYNASSSHNIDSGPSFYNGMDSWNDNDDRDGQWKTVRNKSVRKRRTNVGTKEDFDDSNTLVASDHTLDVYVGRVGSSKTDDDIKTYVKTNFNVDTVSIEKLGINVTHYNAFKVTVFHYDRPKLLDTSLWPKGIAVGKYYHPRSRMII